MLSIRSIALAASLAVASVPALADPVNIYESIEGSGPLGQKWTGSWAEGWNITEIPSIVTIEPNTLSYHYLSGGSWIGTPTQTYVFGTTAAKAGQLSLAIELSSNRPWEASSTAMYLWQGDIGNKQLLAGATNDEIVSTLVSLNLTEGEAWGFMAVGGSINDVLAYTGPVYGSFTVTEASAGGQVPEPAPLALLGLGVLGLLAARRKAQ